MQVSVPASTTNLGHGFDCLGMAIALRNTVQVTPGGAPAGEPGLAAIAERVRALAQERWGVALPSLGVAVTGAVPIARGLGSSATITVALAHAARAIAGLPADPDAVIGVASLAEGHPDNAAAACLGGITIAAEVAGRIRVLRIDPPPELAAVVVIPPYEVVTAQARAILPPTQERAVAVRALQRTALIVGALTQDRLAELADVFADAWHETYRAGLNPILAPVRAAAASAGALGTFLSGSGSTVLSLVRRSQQVALRERLAALDLGTVLPVEIDRQGVRTA